VKLFQDLEARGIVNQTSHPELADKLNSSSDPIKFYIGYDPTAPSLQIGNLFVITAMMRLERAGHLPFVLLGGATGMIGDPSGKSSERVLLSEDVLVANVASQRKQFEHFLGKASFVNNYDWMKNFSFLEYLRVVGKRFRVGEMLAKDSVQARLNSDTGLSFTEFSYQTLQSYDFYHLNQNHGVTLQMGATDQWGNITAGIDFTRKMNGNQVYGMVVPLVTDSQGKKFGKSEGGTALYLDPTITSPYQMYQFFFNAEDQSVMQYLKYYTFLDMKDLLELEREVTANPHLREAQKVLAQEIVKMVHGEAGLAASEKATRIFFGESIEGISESELAMIFKDVPSVEVAGSLLAGQSTLLADLLAMTPLFKSKGEAKRSLSQKGIYLNNKPIEDAEYKISQEDLVTERSLLIRKGKKNYCLVKFLK
jgi:tyrosyl-tRNA synthetase